LTRKRAYDQTDTELTPSAKRERQYGEDGSTTASTDEHHSSNSDSDATSYREHVDDDTASLASIMLSIARSCGNRTTKLQPSTAETVIKINMSAASSVTGDENDLDDDCSGDVMLIKKQRRREKNRASAQQSRQRKKCHLETLEVRVEELERERAALLSRVDALAAENRRLRALGNDANAAAAAAEPLRPLQIKAEEIACAGLLNQLAQAAQKLSRISAA
jgi:tRNA(Phe) wybutosine-synthesizing methylase Tyw3